MTRIAVLLTRLRVAVVLLFVVAVYVKILGLTPQAARNEQAIATIEKKEPIIEKKEQVHNAPTNTTENVQQRDYTKNDAGGVANKKNVTVLNAAIGTTTVGNNKDPSWNQSSKEESREYIQRDGSTCDHPYRHCCLGQCRQESLRIPKQDVLWKFQTKEKLANLTTVLDYLANTNNQRQANSSSCNIVFLGDSLSSDHAMAATCQLLQAGYILTSCNPRFGGPAFGNDTNATCESNLHPTLAHNTLENDRTTSCPRVTIVFQVLNAEGNNERFQKDKLLLEGGGIFAFNWGVHCNNRDVQCLHDALRTGILPMIQQQQDVYRHWKFLFREHEPQHFYPGGVFVPGIKAQCGQIVGQADNWRNQAVQNWLADYNLTSQVATIPLFDALVPLWQLHHPKDCTHYCYDPLRFDVTWNGMLQALTARQY